VDRDYLELHPVYGSVPRDGDLVQSGDVLGLSADERDVVIAPVSGRIRLVTTPGDPHHRLHVQILQEHLPDGTPSASDAAA